jgi:putative redox protein
MPTHEVHLNWISGVAYEVHQNDRTMTIDGTSDIGGQELGMRPKALMLSAIAGCTGIDVAMILHKKRVTYQSLSIAVTGTLTDTEPSVYTHVHIIYSIQLNSEDDRDKMERAVMLSQDKYCGVSAMFRAFATLSHEVVFL